MGIALPIELHHALAHHEHVRRFREHARLKPAREVQAQSAAVLHVRVVEVREELRSTPRRGEVPDEQELLAGEYHEDSSTPVSPDQPEATQHQPRELQPTPPASSTL